METFIAGLIGGIVMIAYMLFRENRVLTMESKEHRKDMRAAQAQVEKLENELEKQQIISSSSKITPFPSAGDSAQKAKYSQLKGEYDSLKNEYCSVIDVLNRIRREVDKSGNMSNSLVIKMKVYLSSVTGLAS